MSEKQKEPIISVELLSAVLDKKVVSIDFETSCDESLFYDFEFNEDQKIADVINLDTLCRKCKEWAYEKGYLIFSGLGASSWGYAELNSIESVNKLGDDAPKIPFGKIGTVPETEVIIKATQWVYDKVKGD